jgi:hypothetical protein
MQKQDKQAFADGYALTCLAYEKKFNPEQAQLYFGDLSEFDISHVINAMTAHRKDPDRGRFFPTISDLIFQINKFRKPVDSKSVAELEWSKVIEAASRGVSLKSSDELSIGSLQIIGGLLTVGNADQYEIGKLKKSFIDCYLSLAACRAEQVPEHLVNAPQIKQIKTQVIKHG